ncbi:MAG: 2-oxoglutarate dehydrogenase E1 component [Planctomycetota bacterium]|nr:2-oxoglutarate dehydrogenase E1 component [Planctomycetota bacterium]MCX8040152.1 2-oxoglutarate dehydrogenase E1 component [Planctomycetota bacterium]MDW8372553.1 2-oxoglutarate dehydrogenase E1 component [Planctomycetota bacterium]
MSTSPDPASLANAALIDELYAAWRRDPASVGRDWQLFFQGFDLGWARPPVTEGAAAEAPPPAVSVSAVSEPERSFQQRVDSLIYAYRDVGHAICNLDPLGLNNRSEHPQLELAAHGLSEADLDRECAHNVPGLPPRVSLRELIAHLRETYCGRIGVEYQHIQDRERRHWVREAVEPGANAPLVTRDDKRRILWKLSQAETLETFIHTKFLGQKRFSLEGADSLIPALDTIIELAPSLRVQSVHLAMAHRGRLNVLCNILGKTYEEIFTEFEGGYDPSELHGDGDVKYHMGFSSEHLTSRGERVWLLLAANPSHLEAVNPVLLGRVRGKQRQLGGEDRRDSVVPVLIHGDAAFAGQGLVMETLQLSHLEGYTVGGTIHIVVNNQIGFTTLPKDSRSTPYCTDIAKMFEAPIFHVNGDDPEAVVHVARLALLYRQRFKRDVFIDLVCYRRWGHNESDEPNYTQPTLYARIAAHPRVRELYAKRLLERGDIAREEVEAIAAAMQQQLTRALETIKVRPARLRRGQKTGAWAGKTNLYTHDPVETGVPAAVLEQVGRALGSWPEGFAIHPKIKRLAEERARTVAEHGMIDWALGEILAFGSLLVEGTPVRLSGQDCRRGTFSQRHLYWYDINNLTPYCPLQHIASNQATICVYDSPLSEAAVLGFDYGYSLAEPDMLIIWEAQFGDFANGAQVIIDQFISSAESKWGRLSGLVMMLPHGQEGQGPEHSSGRLERFLQLCGDDNIQVAVCTTAAQHFHILRRQMRRSVRKPLVLFTPKSHLRSKAASSPFEEFVSGRFREVLGDPGVPPARARRVVVCTGKVYHDLNERRREEGRDDIALIRIEQLYPLHERLLAEVLQPYAAAELVWCQEEPQNMGAWSYIAPILERVLGKKPLYAGREAAASPAPGSPLLFALEQEQLIAGALAIAPRKIARARH